VVAGTDPAYGSVTKIDGSLVHGVNTTVDWRIVGRHAIGALPASLLILLRFYLLSINLLATNTFITKVPRAALVATALAPVFLKDFRSSYLASRKLSAS
jgi:hypothetical protein